MCVYCRDTDEIHRHDDAPVERVPSGAGQGGDVGGYGEGASPSPAYLRGWLLALEERIEALEIMVLELRAKERLSGEP